ncbi:MAG: hypothetical protein IJU25_02725, partial [Lachnospiraceae bacterium]|nr:hypothetical protein [Lachnospiraceae bacterium]
MKNVIRKITTWLLVFGMTFTPVLTSIDAVAANAGEEDLTIVVGGKSLDLSSDLMTDETKQNVTTAGAANDAAADAEKAAGDAAQAAADAAAAAQAAEDAADAAEALVTAATNAANAINKQDGTVTFEKITYTQDDLENSPITYTIHEIA